MEFNEQDKQEYITYLKRSIREENRQPESIAKKFNLNNLRRDLEEMTK